MKEIKPELVDAIDTLAKQSEEISGILGQILAALREINNSQKAATVVLREISSNLSSLRR